MQFVKVAENALDVIQRVGTLGMPGKLRDLPGGQLAEDILGKRDPLLLQLGDLVGDTDLAAGAYESQFLDFGFQFRNRLFKFEEIRIHVLPLVTVRSSVAAIQ